MRILGFTLALLVASGSPLLAEPPSELDGHLAAWERSMKSTKSLAVSFDMVREEAVFKRQRRYKGQAVLMQPNLIRCSLQSTDSPSDYESYICNEKSMFIYSFAAKSVTEFPASFYAEFRQLRFDMVMGMTVSDSKKRFATTLIEPAAEGLVTLRVASTRAEDKKLFQSAQVSLRPPEAKTPLAPHIVSKVVLWKPNGDIETWSFRDHKHNVPQITPEAFRYEPPGKGWKEARWQPLKP
jgi:TIGR03009 family protein